MNTTISLYQVRRDLDNYGDLYNNNLAYVQRFINFKKDLNKYYEKTYEFTQNTDGIGIDELLDNIYNMFTMNLPDDFRGRRMDISDVVIIDDKLFFRDSYGFQEIN